MLNFFAPDSVVLMKQATLYGAGDLRLQERPLGSDQLEDDQVYVKTEVTALSTGTDLGNYEGRSTEPPGAADILDRSAIRVSAW